MKISTHLIVCIALLALQGNLKAQTIVERGISNLYHLDPSGKLIYSKDIMGNRLPDFSYVGYHSGEREIPHVPVKITLEPCQGDDTKRIQDAMDKLGTLSPDKEGFRGALLLKRGVYRVEGALIISHSGTVLRGEGNGPGGTLIIATGYDDMKYKRALISVGPISDHLEAHILPGFTTDRTKLLLDSRQQIIDAHVPVGSNSFEVMSASAYKSGDHIVVHRPSTQAWIHSIGCDVLAARWAGIRDIRWVKDGEAPGFYYQRLGYDRQYSLLQKQDESWDDFVKRVPLSEDGKEFNFTRQWEAGEYDFYFERRITRIEGNRITIDIPIVHSMKSVYGGGAIYKYETPGRVTEVGIENLRLVSEFAAPIPNYPYGDPEETTRAETHAWNGIHIKSNTENIWVRDVTGNYFGWSLVSASGKRSTIQDCIGINSQQNAGPHHRYSVGTLFDNVKSERPMESRFRGNSGTGHGWAGTQTCFYNCIAPEFLVDAPPGGISWVIGSSPENEYEAQVSPASLYYQQVQDRLGKATLDKLVTEEQQKHLGEYCWVKEKLKNERKSDESEK